MSREGGAFVPALVVAGAAIILASTISFVWVFVRNPTPLRVALIGPRGSGKTVYLTVLFSEVKDASSDLVAFQPYGFETVEQALSYMDLLLSRQWPPPTSPGEVIPYRAKASVRTPLITRRYTVEIGDYAGEHIEEFDSSSSRWLHRTQYFSYAIQSDVLFLAVDAESLLTATPEEMAKIESQLVAVMHILLDEKGVAPPEKLAIPVVLTVLKADLLSEANGVDAGARKGLLDRKLGRLMGLAERRCSRFTWVFVSSVGRVDEEGKPCIPLEPKGVAEPLVWALLHARPS